MNEVTHPIPDNFNLEHLRKFTSVYNTLVRHEGVNCIDIIYYNSNGKVILHKSTSDSQYESIQLQLMNIIIDMMDFDFGFTKEDMQKVNGIFKYTIQNKYRQFVASIMLPDGMTVSVSTPKNFNAASANDQMRKLFVG